MALLNIPLTIPDFIPDNGVDPGAHGLVPAPAAGDLSAGKILGVGGWEVPGTGAPAGDGVTSVTGGVWDTPSGLGERIDAATDKPTPVDADELGLSDSAASFILKKLSWLNVKATLKTYFDTLYAAIGSGAPSGTGITSVTSGVWDTPSGLGERIHAATGKTTPVDADELALSDSAASFVLKKLTWANVKATMYAAWGALVAAGTAKTTPVDADSFAISDSAASNATKKLTFTNLKAFLKTYFDTLYGTKVVRFSITIQAPTNGMTLPVHIAGAGLTINSVRYQTRPSTGGSVTVLARINTTTITGLGAMAVTTTQAGSTATAANVMVANDVLYVDFSSVSAPVNCILTFTATQS